MDIQKAEEFARKIDSAIDGGFCDPNAANAYSIAADLIRARDKAIIERCKEAIRKYEHCAGCPAGNDMSLLLDSILRDLD